MRSAASECKSSSSSLSTQSVASSTQARKLAANASFRASSSINRKSEAISDSRVPAASFAANRLLFKTFSRNWFDNSCCASEIPRPPNNPMTPIKSNGPTIPNSISGRRSLAKFRRSIAAKTCCTFANRSSGFFAIQRSTIPTNHRSMPRTR